MSTRARTVTIMGITVAQLTLALLNRLKEPRVTPVLASFATRPTFCRPRNAMNRPMPAGMALAHGVGDGGEDLLAQAGDGQQNEDEAVNENEHKGVGVGEAEADADGINEEGVQAHAEACASGRFDSSR